MSQPPPFEGIYNFRDVGASINACSPVPLLKEGVFFRSGRLSDALPSDRQKLVSTYKIATVIDLRTKSEHKAEPTAPAPWQTVRIDFLRTLEPRLLLELSWWRILYFFLLLLFGLRTRAIRVISNDVLRKKGLVGLSRDSLRYCQPQLLQCLEILRDRKAYPVLVHCTQGKDRTGLLAMLVGLALEVPVEALKQDYAKSNEGLVDAREVMLRELEEVGLGDEFLSAPEMFVEEVVGFLEEEWGGVEAYLDAIGFGKGKREELKALLSR